MNLILLMLVVLGLGLAFTLCVVCRRIGSAGKTLPVTAEWIDELSMERYRPMFRLLDGQDIRFLRSQPGFTPNMVLRLRVQRCQIFRGYLRCLSSDFGRICAAIKLMMLQSRRDRPDLAAVLIRNQLLFATSMIVVYGRLTLYRYGICGVDVSSLVRTFDVMRIELRQLVPSTVASAA